MLGLFLGLGWFRNELSLFTPESLLEGFLGQSWPNTDGTITGVTTLTKAVWVVL